MIRYIEHIILNCFITLLFHLSWVFLLRFDVEPDIIKHIWKTYFVFSFFHFQFLEKKINRSVKQVVKFYLISAIFFIHVWIQKKLSLIDNSSSFAKTPTTEIDGYVIALCVGSLSKCSRKT